jgi:hypothetical protein
MRAAHGRRDVGTALYLWGCVTATADVPTVEVL